MCAARASRYPARHLPRHGPADLLRDLIHMMFLNGTHDLSVLSPPLSLGDPTRAGVIGRIHPEELNYQRDVYTIADAYDL